MWWVIALSLSEPLAGQCCVPHYSHFLRDREKMAEVVIVERLDGGGPHDKGCYRCTKEGCMWQLKDGGRTAPSGHIQHAHPGSRVKVRRMVRYARKGSLTEAERKAKRAELERTRNRRRKVGADSKCVDVM